MPWLMAALAMRSDSGALLATSLAMASALHRTIRTTQITVHVCSRHSHGQVCLMLQSRDVVQALHVVCPLPCTPTASCSPIRLQRKSNSAHKSIINTDGMHLGWLWL